MTELGPIDGQQLTNNLRNYATYHAYTGEDPYSPPPDIIPLEQFVFERYSSYKFQGFIPDTGAAKLSTAGERQVEALQKPLPELRVDRPESAVKIRFGDNTTKVTGCIDVPTPIEQITRQ